MLNQGREGEGIKTLKTARKKNRKSKVDFDIRGSQMTRWQATSLT